MSEPKVITPLAEAAAWGRKEIERRVAADGEVRLPDVGMAMVAHFSADAAWVARLLPDILTPLLYDVARSAAASTRSHITYGGVVVDREEFVQKAVSAPKWRTWLEKVGDRHVQLFDMSKAELLTAASERRARGANEIKTAALWETLASRMGDRQKVADVWSEGDITTTAASLRIDIATKISHVEPPAMAAD